MYILTCNDQAMLASEDYNTLKEEMTKEIDKIINNKKYDNVHHTDNEVWYYNGISHHHNEYCIQFVEVI